MKNFLMNFLFTLESYFLRNFGVMKIWWYIVLEFEECGHILHAAKNNFSELPVSRLLRTT